MQIDKGDKEIIDEAILICNEPFESLLCIAIKYVRAVMYHYSALNL